MHTDSKKAALVALEGGDAELARDLAMQVVAASPRYITPADAPADLVAKEREIETEKAKTEPANAKQAGRDPRQDRRRPRCASRSMNSRSPARCS